MARSKFPKKTNGNGEVAESTTAALNTAAETPKKSVRKPSVIKGGATATLVPINLDDEIRRLAYLLSERRGFEPGHETEDWLTAESEVLERYRHHTA